MRKAMIISITMAVAVIALALLLSACNTTQEAEAVDFTVSVVEAGDAPVIKTVVLEGHQFNPQDLDIKVGDTVEWVNKDGVDYTLYFLDYPLFVEFIDGATFTHTFMEAGDYSYISQYSHEEDDQEEDPEQRRILQATIHVSE